MAAAKTVGEQHNYVNSRILEEIYNPKALGRLLTDAYHHTTGAGYMNEGREGNNAVFYLFGRKPASNGSYTVGAGLEFLVNIISRWQSKEFREEDAAFLRAQKTPSGKPKFTEEQISRFVDSDFNVKLDAAPEGSLLFPQEAAARIEGPAFQAKLLESVALSIYNGQGGYSSHAARLTDVLSREMKNGSPKGVASVQGLRRGPSIGAAFEASRALEIGGYTSTSTGAAAKIFGQVYAGTMDHAWVMTHTNEVGVHSMQELFDMLKLGTDASKEELKEALKSDAFRSFAFTHQEAGILLLDTYDADKGLDNAITVIKELHSLGLGNNYGVRFDSDDLVKWSKKALRRFAEEGLLEGFNREQVDQMSDAELLLQSDKCKAFCAAADGIDEYTAQEMREQGCFFKFWGVGTGGSHVPPLGMVYKASSMDMEVHHGEVDPEDVTMENVMKVIARNPEKSSNPGRLNSKRYYDENGKLHHVVVYDENLGLDPEGRAAERHHLGQVQAGISTIGKPSDSLLVPVFDANGKYVYKEPEKRESYAGSGKYVTDLAAIAKTVKAQVETLPEGARRIVRPRKELIAKKLMAHFNGAKDSGKDKFSVSVDSILANLPPEAEQIPVYLDYNLLQERHKCEEKHSIVASGEIKDFGERFDGHNDKAVALKQSGTRLINVDGKKTAVINMFIDPENGFLNPTLALHQGGSLYVPKGEEVGPMMAEIIDSSANSIFVIAQDYHPANHISFMTNHPGVMEYRIEKFKQFLAENGQPVPDDAEELYRRAQQPVHFFNGYDHLPVPFPFEEIVLGSDRNIIGLKEADGRIRRVEVTTESGLEPSEKDIGRVTKVLDRYYDRTFDEWRASGAMLSTQTLWTPHCIQGTESCQYPDSMHLPEGLKLKLKSDMMSKTVNYRDPKTGNQFYVVRKGNRSEVDSYGIGLENDKKTLTPATEVFASIADKLQAEGCENVILNIGGLATNFCVEFSANNVVDFLAGHFRMRDIDTQVNFVPDISRGIPIPGGADVPFSEAGAGPRMEATRGIHSISLEKVLELQKPGKTTAGDLLASGPVQQKIVAS